MHLHINDDAGPIFRQIVEQIRHRIYSGVLRGGDELPPIRSLATRLAVNPNTVVRAYRELEQMELIEKRRTAGTFVRDDVQSRSATARKKMLHPAIDDLIAQATGLGFDADDLCELIRQRTSHVTREER